MKSTPAQIALNDFQAKIRILKKEQRKVLSDFRARLEQLKLKDLRNKI